MVQRDQRIPCLACGSWRRQLDQHQPSALGGQIQLQGDLGLCRALTSVLHVGDRRGMVQPGQHQQRLLPGGVHQAPVLLGLLDSQFGILGQLPVVVQHKPHGAGLVGQIGQPDFFEQNHRDVTTALCGWAVKRKCELLDLIANSILLQRRGHDRQTVGQLLALPRLLKTRAQITNVEPHAESIGVAIVVPHAGTAIDAKLGDGAVPGQADDVAWPYSHGVGV